jgi:integrase/recombinase XerD
MLNSYRDRLPAPLQEPEAWMFISKQGGRLTTVQKLMRRLFNEAGISSRGVLMHGLRKGAATSMLRGGADLETVRTVLGHSSVLVTQAYLQTDDDALLAAADRSLF